MTANWQHLRALFALDGIEWRGWSAADRCAVAFLMLKRRYRDSGDMTSLRDLFELVGDREAVAEVDREIMGQPRQIEVTNG